jgi:hypothetical protein
MFGMRHNERLAIRCDARTLEELERRAEAEDRSVASVARRAIARGLRDDVDEKREGER